jgi:hypothetical protein
MCTDATSSAPPGKRLSSSASASASVSASASSKNSRGTALTAPSAAAKAGTPIFIVPDALTATFSGFNATQFLRDGNFVPSGKLELELE